MIIAGLCGFILGFSLGLWRNTDLAMAFLRGGVVCVASTLSIRFILMRIFSEHLEQLKLRKKAEVKAEEKPKS